MRSFSILACTLAVLLATGVGLLAYTSGPTKVPKEELLSISDKAYTVAAESMVEEEEYYEEVYYEPASSYYYSESYDYPTEGLTMQGGVNYYDGRRETWYSSNVLYHYRTSEWYVDEEGFYRDSDGFYVVAASDMEQGTVFEGSKGECKVYDSGCAEGTTDYYVKW